MSLSAFQPWRLTNKGLLVGRPSVAPSAQMRPHWEQASAHRLQEEGTPHQSLNSSKPNRVTPSFSPRRAPPPGSAHRLWKQNHRMLQRRRPPSSPSSNHQRGSVVGESAVLFDVAEAVKASAALKQREADPLHEALLDPGGPVRRRLWESGRLSFRRCRQILSAGTARCLEMASGRRRPIEECGGVTVGDQMLLGERQAPRGNLGRFPPSSYVHQFSCHGGKGLGGGDTLQPGALGPQDRQTLPSTGAVSLLPTALYPWQHAHTHTHTHTNILRKRV